MKKPETQEDLFRQFGALPKLVAHDYSTGVLDMDDLIQAANVGLILAWQSCDWDAIVNRTMFNSYARKAIRAELREQTARVGFATSGSGSSLHRHEFHTRASLEALEVDGDAEDFSFRPSPEDRAGSGRAMEALKRRGLSHGQAEAFLVSGDVVERSQGMYEARATEASWDALDASGGGEPEGKPRTPSRQMGETWTELDAILSSFDILTARQRRIMELYYMDALLSDETVGRVLGITQQAVNKARLKAEETLREVVFGPTSDQ